MDERAELITQVIEKHGLRSKSRKRELVYKRKFLCHFMLDISLFKGNLTRIGNMLNTDHSMVIHHRRTHNDLTEVNDKFYLEIVNEMKADISAVFAEYHTNQKVYAANVTFYVGADCDDIAQKRIQAIFNTIIAKDKVLTGIVEVDKEQIKSRLL